MNIFEHIANIGSFFLKVLQQFSKVRVPFLAASLSYYTLLSLAPLLFILTLSIRVISGFFAIGTNPLQSFEGIIPQAILSYLQGMMEQGVPAGDGLVSLIIALIFLFFAVGGLMNALQYSLNTIWQVRVESRHIKGTLLKKIRNVAILALVGTLLPALSLASLILSILQDYIKLLLPFLPTVFPWMQWFVLLCALMFSFVLILKYIPDIHLAWAHVWIGACITAVLFIVGQLAIGLYFKHMTVASAEAAAGSVIVFLVWMYYSAQVFLFGAVCTQVLSLSFGERAVPAEGASYHKSVSVEINALSPFQKIGVVFNTIMSQIKIVRLGLWLKNIPENIKRFFRK